MNEFRWFYSGTYREFSITLVVNGETILDTWTEADWMNDQFIQDVFAWLCVNRAKFETTARGWYATW